LGVTIQTINNFKFQPEWDFKQGGEILVKLDAEVGVQSNQQVTVIQIVTVEGEKIAIPMLDMIHVEIDKGVKLFVGRVFDIFASPKEEKRAKKADYNKI
jgi:hypothetical protein